MTDATDQPFIRHFKIGFAAACGAIVAVSLALSIAFAVNGLMDAAAERRERAEVERLRAKYDQWLLEAQQAAAREGQDASAP